MSLDGTFSLRFELERFLDRCPKLSHLPNFTNLLGNGEELIEDEVVNAVALIFLHPDYTIPIIGCFRAVAKKIVVRVVELLKLLPNLRCVELQRVVNGGVDGDRFFVGCEEFTEIESVGVIEAYARRGRFLDLHELVGLAFSRVLDMVPFLKGIVGCYYEFGGPPFARIAQMNSTKTSTEDARHLRDIVWTTYRLLLQDPEYFSGRWNWCCFIDLVHQFGSTDSSSDGLVREIRWCGVQTLCLLLKLPNRSASFGIQPVDVLTCLLRWYEFCWDVSIEKSGWYISRKSSSDLSDRDNFVNGGDSVALDALELLERAPHDKCKRYLMRNSEPFLMTSTLRTSFERVVLAVNQKWPVLLYGPPGCGKTSLINKLADETGNQVLLIHMDEHVDGKTLIGSYVCSEQPGEFRWQPGPLTQAVKTGLWIVFENIDQAAPDVQSILLPLLEGGISFLTGYGEAIRVSGGFRLFATVSTLNVDICHHADGSSALSALWRRVMIKPPTRKDLPSIVTTRYPDLEPVAERVAETFEKLAGVSDSIAATVTNCYSRFSLRDLMKWCKRIAGSDFSFRKEFLSVDVRNRIFIEAVDVFAAFSASPGNRLTIVRNIAEMWAVPLSTAETLYSLNRPVLQDLPGALQIGRVTLQRSEDAIFPEKKPFVEILSSFHVLERIACSVKWNEPVLLVGETGTGKTTLVQNLATRLGQQLTVLNLSQQSDIADLLGGFKPMDPQHICMPLYKEFENLFSTTFSLKENEKYLPHYKEYVIKKKWAAILKEFQRATQVVLGVGSNSGTKRKRPLEKEKLVKWESFSRKVEVARKQILGTSGMIFSFIEGAFVSALRNGQWILLDEVNLAPLETLQRIIGVLDREGSSLCLVENGVFVERHPNFRLFACMNPATDAGKRDLPYALRSRFTEFFVDDVLNDEDLALFVNKFLVNNHKDKDLVSKIVHFYKAAKKDSEERLQDGANQRPQYSLRSLYRALEYTHKASYLGFRRALYDGFCMFFMTLLDGRSAELMHAKILSCLLGGDKLPPPIPLDRLLDFRESPGSEHFLREYVITKSVEEHLRNLARAAFIKRYPVLLQGPTSSGKTSLVQYLAAKTGHEFVRINNHEHTDLQEYLGSYITDSGGRLVFHEGVLVKAVRNGHWIVLDELNLAPSDVLEALNRLLDDNRELFVPELRETVRAHPDFMLFATQNPPTFYGGRKMLSRAFRNRFVELHVDEIPDDELTEILEKKCKIAPSYAKKMIVVMKDLQLRRQNSKVFAGKHGFITPRDLFRWADRSRKYGCSYEDLARDGYYLLAERLREESEKNTVQEVLEKLLRVKLKTHELYSQGPARSHVFAEGFHRIVQTGSMQRLFYLVERCYELKEPVLLVGETGGGKTTVCQLLSMALNAKLHILNCHQFTETSDFIGGFFPIRERSKLASDFKNLIEQLSSSKGFFYFLEDISISGDIGKAPSTLDQLSKVLDDYKQSQKSLANVCKEDIDYLEKVKEELSELYQKWQTIFIWQDGPLVQAMKHGDLFLVDEISLADDSVLERLNSVLEPDRKLSLAEKGGPDLEIVKAHDDFFLLATMNPGGDYGKKELSPALRNRFTEIWVPAVGNLDELGAIAQRLLNSELHYFVGPLINFWEWFNQLQTGRTLSVRDLLAWLDFMTKTTQTMQPDFAFLHGAFLVLLDGLSLGTGLSKNETAELRERSIAFLVNQLKNQNSALVDSELLLMENYGWAGVKMTTACSHPEEMQCDNVFGIYPFYIDKGSEVIEESGFEFLAPTTRRNVLRVLRSMQLKKPVLLEGSPGVGKTSLIAAVGKFSGHKVVRINLSEQTDIMDLLGSDLPVESEEGLQFAWSDGILLQALREGSWVLLDEINLAQQSVLEGLNAILDHRAEVFIPELGQSFKCPSSFRVFACQNPTYQGGGRKGLPKSFLNRFSKVYVDELSEDDYLYICRSLFPAIPESILSKLILFNKRLYEETMLCRKFAQEGSPWEFNLRDVIRSCQIIQGAPGNSEGDCFLNVVYVQRMRTAADRREVLRLYEEVFGSKPCINSYPRVELDDHYLRVGSTCIKRNHFQSVATVGSELKILPGIKNSMEAAVQCIQQQWLCILVGPTSSGKTSMIRLLAHLTGNVLNEINLSAATDISDLLGSFEQYNAYRNFCSIVTKVEGYIKDYCSLLLGSCADSLLVERRDLITKWLHFSSNFNFGHMLRSDTADDEKWKESLALLIEIIELLKSDVQTKKLPVSSTMEDLSLVLHRAQKLLEIQKGKPGLVKFEWAAGLLIKAIENGEWIVLENANLCNPTVLDRINSLAESNGSITVNECGNVDGKPLVLTPHSNFRMFLTVNPRYGDVSRAMRNRGIEIFVMQPHWLMGVYEKEDILEFELEDVKFFLASSNIPSKMLVNSMARAHMHARREALHVDIQITYLELGRWIYLLQQLLIMGNDLLWSLHRSFEHSYVSSLGESDGWHIVREAEGLYLSNISGLLLKGNFIVNCQPTGFEPKPVHEILDGQSSLCVSAGWPAPLRLQDFIWNSKGACVRQFCMYLESLGVQFVSYKHSISKRNQRQNSNSPKSIYLVDLDLLQTLMYPKSSNGEAINYLRASNSDAMVSSKKLLYAVHWVMDQVVGKSDLELCLLWFRWFDYQLQPYCKFFGSMECLLRKELGHPIWRWIFTIQDEILSDHNVNVDLHSLPILALESVDVLARVSMSSAKRLFNAIKCVGLLRLSLWQWNAEIDCNDVPLKSMMLSLQKLEQEVLSVIVESPMFDSLYLTYADLLEVHVKLWDVFILSQFETLLVHWRALVKIALKMKKLFPAAVKNVLDHLDMMSRNLRRKLPYSLNSEKSLLWAYGGHPSLPHSADIYYKLEQLTSLTKLLWPRKIILPKHNDYWNFEFAASTNPQLRFRAMQGVCMTSSLVERYEAENVVEELEEMYQMLRTRVECGKNKLEMNAAGAEISEYALDNSACCTTVSETMWSRSWFESWIESLPIANDTSLSLDLLLLEDVSSSVSEDVKHLQTVLSGLRDRLNYSLDFSINFSSRTPLDFVPHQEMIWMLDAWPENTKVGLKVITSVYGMWFSWHSSLWNCQLFSTKELSGSDVNEFVLPDMLFKPVKTDTVHHILQNSFLMKDYHINQIKLRVASSNIWQSIVPHKDLHSCLLNAACSLLQQIISAHRKSFAADTFVAINSFFLSLQKKELKQGDINNLLSHLASSSHHTFVSLLESFVEPLVKDITNIGCSEDLLLRISRAWLRLGGLRFYLLLACDELDPAVKHCTKYQNLVNKCNSLAAEIEVRRHCDYLVGSLTSSKSNEEKAILLERLEFECKRLQRKIVFRSDPGRFIKLKEECNEFSENVNLGLTLLQETSLTMPSLISRAGNWQVTANHFVDRLAEEYSSYVDIIQPIQVAVYEMKLGMALLSLNAMQKDFVGRIQDDKIDSVLDAVYAFMRFPHGYLLERQLEIDSSSSGIPLHAVNSSVCIWEEKMELLKKLITSTEMVGQGRKVSTFELEASLFDNILGHVLNAVASTKMLDNVSFRMLNKVFNFFTSLWRDLKVHEEIEKDNEAQLYKFRPRAFKLDDVCEIDLSSLGNSFSSDSFSEWKELLHDKESSQKKESTDQSDSSGSWNLIPESILNTLVNVHNRLFGSSNLVEMPGIVQLSDAEKLCSFVKTYTVGSSIVKDLTGMCVSLLDARLAPEHVLRLSLEHEQKRSLSEKPTGARNFYKDPNPPVVAGMVRLLVTLRHQVLAVLKEREEDPGLQKILEITEMLLALPPSTSVAQALSGLQFLVTRVKSLQDHGAKLPFNAELQPILSIISCFQKMEFDAWNTMLDEVLIQFEVNASKLWFPLHSVIYRMNNTDINEYAQSTLQSLEDLIRTSNVGEFKRRLQLIFSFYGQLSAGICLGSYTSDAEKENRNILYNVFGFYVQLLPLVLDHIETSTKSIKKELEDLLKLCRWEHPEKQCFVENSKRNRQKLKKLIEKYTEALQEPVMHVLAQESTRHSLKSLKLGQAPVKNQELSVFDASQFDSIKRAAWYDDWNKKFDSVVGDLQLGQRLESQASINSSKVDSEAEGHQFFLETPSQAYQGNWSQVWHNLENICRAVVETAAIWKEEGKLQVKTRAFSDFLKLLESSGLFKHRANIMKLLEGNKLLNSKPAFSYDQFNKCQSDWWFFLPSYDVQHLQLKLENVPFQEFDVAAFYHTISTNSNGIDEKWKFANHLYFKSLASVKHLEQISLNFHKDFKIDQINRSNTFLGHLVIIQMEQRDSAYVFAEQLKSFRESILCVRKLCAACSSPSEADPTELPVSAGQQHFIGCMWQQKKLFDALCSTMDEESLMLTTVQNAHLRTCDSIKPAADDILVFIEKYKPLLENSKAVLDDELLGGGSAVKVTASTSSTLIITKMKQFVVQNFQLIRELQKDLLALHDLRIQKSSVVDILLTHLEDIIDKAKIIEEEFLSSQSTQHLSSEVALDVEGVIGSIHDVSVNITNALYKLGSWSNRHGVAQEEKITSWKPLFESYAADLQLDLLNNDVQKIITSAAELANIGGISCKITERLMLLEELLAMILAFGDGLLHDFLDVHQMVCVLTHSLAKILSSLFSEGYGTPAEDQADDSRGNRTQDASGTGMGEGAGVKDVSDQITDEDQLLGTSGEREEQDAPNENPSKNEQGIEMTGDINAEAENISEDSEEEDKDDEGDGEEDQLDDAMGNTGESGEIADEKLWDKEEDKNLDATNEKYDPGSSVKDRDPSNRELRAKDDSAATDDEVLDKDSDVSGEDDNMDSEKDGVDEKEDTEGLNFDKEEANADPTDIDLDEQNQTSVEDDDNMEVDLPNSAEEEVTEEEQAGTDNEGEENDASVPEDEGLAESSKLTDKCEDNSENKDDKDGDTNTTQPSKDMTEQNNSDMLTDQFSNSQISSQPVNELQKAESGSTAPELKWSMSGDIQNNLNPSEHSSHAEVLLGNSLEGKLTNDLPKSQLPQQDSSSFQNNQPNPLRNLGDALQDWKERVKISADLPETKEETIDELMDEAADEYGYTSEFQKGTAQALGPAMPDQLEHDAISEYPDKDGLDAHEESKTEVSQHQDTDTEPVHNQSFISGTIDKKMSASDMHEEVQANDVQAHSQIDVYPGKPGESLVSVSRSYMTQEKTQVSELRDTGDELMKLQKHEMELSNIKANGYADWRSYELRTTRLSQELAEQLRLIMEPTLASKLQGDYRTGKRINMKKVIPYIASHYRKDKIWLRRTKPNKRDYQVVIAVDDSRSMSENGCGGFALEALVTVCRALSQLEVGKLAVTSFGKQGNVRLLHDFDQPLTGEAGMQMISSLKFDQENTLNDEPMVDLLSYLCNMLKQAVAKSRLPSGQNPLQQLVLIIADGRFHDNKEKVKRYVTDILNRNCMVAFLLLDSGEESIMEYKDYSFKNGLLEKAAYLDSFPFPYYIVLRNIESLPRTLADLLRQWFELMQNSRD